MGQGRILTRGARVFGAVACAALALISLAWIIRDLGEADETSHLWWTWAGLPYRVPWGGVFGSSLLDAILLVLAVFAGVAALRSSAAAGALGALGLITVVLRLPLVWTVQADWLDAAPIADGLRTRATLTGWGGLLLGVALLVVAAAGRRPAEPADSVPGAPPADRPATVPGPGAAVAAVLFLGSVGCVIAAWQIYWAQELGWDTYRHLLSGKHVFVTLLAPPAAWAAWAAVLLSLVAAAAAGARTAYARPLGMMAAAIILVDGIADTSVYFKTEYIEHFEDLPTRETLAVLSSFFEVLAGFVALVALAQRGLRPGESWPGAGWGPGHPTGAAPGGHAGATGHGYGPGYGYGAADGGPAPAGYGGGTPGGPAVPGGAVPPPPAGPPPASPPPPPSPPPGW
ncbi:hypothetical protein [Streptomyces sp. NPDC018031]|uniref:hypothetical protein n=1 Tax=Streptomyces sp. NPDC018031 TaxID=3365033 RepID=UPI0037A9AA23